MILQLSTIPDDSTAWPQWLEQQLVGTDLARLIAELEILAAEEAGPVAEELPISTVETIVQHGLRTVPPETIGEILRTPRTLLHLQEQIFLGDSDYWSAVRRSDELINQTRQDWRAIESKFEPGESTTAAGSPAPQARRFPRRLLVIATTAAAALLTATLFLQDDGWGFSRPGLLTAQAASAQEFFSRLARAAEDWHDQDDATPEQMLSKLDEFSQGCETLMSAALPQLAAAERQWLVDKTQDWKSRADSIRGALAADPARLAESRRQANTLITRLTQTLRAGPVGAATPVRNG